MTEHDQSICHIACSYDGPLFAVAEFERFVQISHARSLTRIARFETTFDWGGNRLAISRNGQYLAAGAYRHHGVALYDATNGSEIWRRSDLREVQDMRISKNDALVMCAHRGDTYDLLNVESGDTELTLQNVEDVFESVYDDVALIDGGNGRHYLLTDPEFKRIAEVRRTSFAALDFAFAPKRICVTESGTLIRCYDVQDGRKVWEFNPGSRDGIHATDVAYNDSQQLFAAVTLNYKYRGKHHDDRRLVALRADDGEFVFTTTIGCVREAAFCNQGSILITSDGNLWNTSTGEVEQTLNFFPDSTAG